MYFYHVPVMLALSSCRFLISPCDLVIPLQRLL